MTTIKRCSERTPPVGGVLRGRPGSDEVNVLPELGRQASAVTEALRSESRRKVQLDSAFGSLGSPSTRSPTMLRWISAVPPQMVSDREKKKEAWRSLTG